MEDRPTSVSYRHCSSMHGWLPWPARPRVPAGVLEREVLACLAGGHPNPSPPGQVLAELGRGLADTTVMTTLTRLAGESGSPASCPAAPTSTLSRETRTRSRPASGGHRMRAGADQGGDRAGVLARFVADLSREDTSCWPGCWPRTPRRSPGPDVDVLMFVPAAVSAGRRRRRRRWRDGCDRRRRWRLRPWPCRRPPWSSGAVLAVAVFLSWPGCRRWPSSALIVRRCSRCCTRSPSWRASVPASRCRAAVWPYGASRARSPTWPSRRRNRRRLGPDVGGLVVVDDPAPDAYARPGLGGVVVVSTATPRAPAARRASRAARPRGGEPAPPPRPARPAAELAAAADPLPRRWRPPCDGVERWADEAVAARCRTAPWSPGRWPEPGPPGPVPGTRRWARSTRRRPRHRARRHRDRPGVGGGGRRGRANAGPVAAATATSRQHRAPVDVARGRLGPASTERAPGKGVQGGVRPLLRTVAGTTTHTAGALSGRADRRWNKVPEVTAYFWVIKILCTTVGETAADLLEREARSRPDGCVAADERPAGGRVLVVQFRTRAYRPGIYWLAVGADQRRRHADQRQPHRQPGRTAGDQHRGLRGGPRRGLRGLVPPASGPCPSTTSTPPAASRSTGSPCCSPSPWAPPPVTWSRSAWTSGTGSPPACSAWHRRGRGRPLRSRPGRGVELLDRLHPDPAAGRVDR